jgi:hypothetical protein
MERIHEHEKLAAEFGDIQLYGPGPEVPRAGVISFNLADVHPGLQWCFRGLLHVPRLTALRWLHVQEGYGVVGGGELVEAQHGNWTICKAGA